MTTHLTPEEFALEQFGSQLEAPELGKNILVEPTDYGFLVKVLNKRKTYDKHGFKLKTDADGVVHYEPVKFTAWTLSIPLSLSAEQEALALDWQEKLRWIWNGGLGLLESFTRYNAYDGQSKAFYSCCPLTLRIDTELVERAPFFITEKTYQWRKETRVAQGKEIEEFVSYLSTPLITPRRKAKRNKYRPSCPISEINWSAVDADPNYVWNPPAVHWQAGTEALTRMSDRDLFKVFAQKANPDKDWLKELPAQPVRAVLKDLAESWSKYFWKKGGGKPRFKSGRKGDKVNSLTFEDASCLGRVWDAKGNLMGVKLPRLGEITIPKNYRDKWKNLPIATVKLVWDCGWQLQLTTTQKQAKVLKPKASEETIEIVGQQGVLFRTQKGKEYTIDLERQIQIEEEIGKLQIGLQYQRGRAEMLAKAGRPSAYLEKKIQKTQKRIRQLHRKMRLAGKAESQKLATFVLRRDGKITIIDKPSHGMLLKPEPIPGETLDAWEPNGAEKVAAVNRSRKMHRTGQFVATLEQKAKEVGREVVIDKETAKATKKTSKKKTKKQLTKTKK